MRIPLIAKIPLYYAIVFAIGMMVLQLFEGTSGAFAMLHFAFILLSVLAFNTAGGMTAASGWYIFFFSTLTVLLGTFLKAILGEQADTLTGSVLTMAAFTVGAAGMLLAIVGSRNLTKSIPSIAARLGASELNYTDASLGCTVMGVLTFILKTVLPAGPGSIMAALTQVDIFLPLAVLLGTIAIAEGSHLRRSFGVVNGMPMALAFFVGLNNFSKEGMITPFVCWIIGLAYTRFRMKLVHLAFCVAFAVLTLTVLYPIAQIGRNFVTADSTTWDRILIGEDLFSNLDNTQQILAGENASVRETAAENYFSHDVGFLERFTRFQGDGDLIQFSSHGHYVGYRVVTDAFLNWFPHFILPQKEQSLAGYGGNYYLHEMGALPDEDVTTGISFSPVPEAFHIDGWRGLAMMTPLIWFLLFLSVDLLCGDIRKTPWGLFFAVAFSHAAPEGSLATMIMFIWHGNLALFLGMFFCIQAAPFAGALLTGGSRRAALLTTPTLQNAS